MDGKIGEITFTTTWIGNMNRNNKYEKLFWSIALSGFGQILKAVMDVA